MSGPVKFEYPRCSMNRLIIKSLVNILRDIMSGELDEPISYKLLVEVVLTDGRRLELISDEFYLNDLSDLHGYEIRKHLPLGISWRYNSRPSMARYHQSRVSWPQPAQLLRLTSQLTFY
jgi:hypothetical protein